MRESYYYYGHILHFILERYKLEIKATTTTTTMAAPLADY